MAVLLAAAGMHALSLLRPESTWSGYAYTLFPCYIQLMCVYPGRVPVLSVECAVSATLLCEVGRETHIVLFG